MKLWQMSGIHGSSTFNDNPALRTVAINAMRAEAPLFNYLEFYSMVGNADIPPKDTFPTGGQSRALGSDFNATTLAPEYGAVSLMILGDKIKTDRAYERRSQSLVDERLRQINQFSKAFARDLTDRIFNEVADSTHIHGIKSLIPDSQTFVLGQTATGTTGDGDTVPAGTSDAAKKKQAQFLESLDYAIAYVEGGPDALAMNSRMIARLGTIARENVQTVTVQDVLGNMKPLTTYNGIPIIDPGFSSSRAGLVIPITETQGNSAGICTSIYALSFGERDDLTVATNCGLHVIDHGLLDNFYTTSFELDLDVTLLDSRAVSALKGIIL